MAEAPHNDCVRGLNLWPRAHHLAAATIVWPRLGEVLSFASTTRVDGREQCVLVNRLLANACAPFG